MRIYTRYLLREMVAPFLGGMGLVMAMMLAHTLIKLEEQGLLSSRAVTLPMLLRWLLYRLPAIAVYALPVATLLAVSLAVIRLARDNEMTALRIGGLSLRQALRPVWLAGLAISALAFMDSEYVVPWAWNRSREVVKEAILNQPRILMKQNVSFRGESDTFFYVRDIDLRRSILYYVLIYRIRQGKIEEVLNAERAERDGSQWYLMDGKHYLFDDQSRPLRWESFERWPIDLNRDIEKYLSSEEEAELMSARDLRELIRFQQMTGQSPRDLLELTVRYYSRFSIPLACFICALLAAPLSLRYAHTGVFTGIVLTIVVVFFYNGWVNWSKVLGNNGVLPPWLAGWSHNIVFGGLGLLLLWRQERA